MEESSASTVSDGEIVGIKFSLATHYEVCKSSISECPISHQSQLSNPFLGLPLEVGKCESCGTAEPGKCEGHFGYIELPIPIYHPDHIIELRRLLNLVCLKCLKLKINKFPSKSNGVLEKLLSSCCEEAASVSIKEKKNTDGAFFLELRLPSRSKAPDGVWDFLEKYGYHYGDGLSRTLLPAEVYFMLKKLPEETKRKLSKKGYFPQEGYILRYLPVPPNCLSVPDISDGVSIMSSDLSAAMLKKVLRQIEIIKSSRSGEPNFESHEVEANELQIAVAQYLQARGTGKASRDVGKRFGLKQELGNSSTKAWLDKMRTLFISKGSGFSSRSVVTGDAYRSVNEIGLPAEIAQRITFEERVNGLNINYLQSLVDNKLCLTYKDGSSTYSLREGSKGHTFLRPGQMIHRRIMDGDIVFINRPPTTHKHSLQALRVYIHEDHTVKINPLMCGPLAADFDGDCVHLFYPQSLSAKAEVVELFSVENQLLSSHTSNLNLQMATDSLLALKVILKTYFLDRSSAQQLAMFASASLSCPALSETQFLGPRWTALQVLQTALPEEFDCSGDRHRIHKSEILSLDFNRDVMPSFINEVATSILFEKGPKDALKFFDALQPLLMEHLFTEGFSVGLQDFFISSVLMKNIQRQMQDTSPLLFQLRSSYNGLVEQQLENYMRLLKVPIVNFILKSSALGNLIDSRRDSAITKVVQQIGFLGLQLSDKGKFYSKKLVEDVVSLFHQKYPFRDEFPSEEFGMVKSSFFHGLDPYEEMVHSIATREVNIRSTNGLAEPGTLFKNLMAVLRDVVICYDGTVRNISSNSVIQFEYGVNIGRSQSLFPAGEPVGVLAATAMSNPAYKAVLDSSPSSNSSWEMMKEILFCRVNFKNDIIDRRVILYLNDCGCGKRYCQENASYKVKSVLKKVSLREAAVEFLIEYKSQQMEHGGADIDTGLVGHIHLNKALLNDSNIGMLDIFQKCQDEINLWKKKKNFGLHFRKINLLASECCCFQQDSNMFNVPCLKFFWNDISSNHLERISHIMADMICPVLLDTIIKGDPRISTVNIVWVSPDSMTWIGGFPKHHKGELAVEVVLEKKAVKQSGDAWRIVLDCCLPVFHIIDTGRSIPYAIKQIQDLFGISCAFEQAVQRLSSSVTTVAKGVLKEHLILLASSMTCAGNLIGFNSSGIKALYRALGPQVPFTEATQYTPRKCFERAAEKCHVDSLSSIVASCSWGKHVAVGTGAKFDIIWEQKEMEKSQEGIDVYNFLQLVRGPNELEQDTGCLGEDIDQFELEDEYMEPGFSPDHDPKAVFEENAEVGIDLETQGQDAGSSWNKLPSDAASGGGWDVNKSQVLESPGWSSWGSKKSEQQIEDAPVSSGNKGWDVNKSQDSGSPGWSSWGSKMSEQQKEDALGTGGWNTPKSWEESSQSHTSSSWAKQENKADSYGAKSRQSAEPPATPWNSGIKEKPADGGVSSDNWQKPVGSSTRRGFDQSCVPAGCEEWKSEKASGESDGIAAMSSWEQPGGEKNMQSPKGWSGGSTWKKNPNSNWSSSKSEKASGESDGIAAKSSWEQPGREKNMQSPKGWSGGSTWKKNPNSNWSSGKSEKVSGESDGVAAKSSWEQPNDVQSPKGWPCESTWKKNPNSNWGSGKLEKDIGESGSNAAKSSWEQPSADSMQSPKGWSSGSTRKNPNSNWNSGKLEKVSGDSDGNAAKSSWEQPSEDNIQSTKGWSSGSTWKKNANSNWGSGKSNFPVEDSDKVVVNSENETQSETRSPWEGPTDNNMQSPAGSTWMKPNSNWGSGKSNFAVEDPDKVGVNSENETQSETQSPWGQPCGSTWRKNRPDNGHGWGSSGGEWKSKKSRPPKSPGVQNADAGGSFTFSKQRVEFTPEEQKIQAEIEPIIQSIRKIMNQPGYNDGDPISAEDQSYVVDNVFSYHPDKVAKMGAGIDHIMVTKHSNFQDTRCFYLVCTDGRKEDFSYKKCLENLIRVKYPDCAEAFIPKYFRRPRTVGNREQESS